MRNLVGVQERSHIHMNATRRQFREEIVDAVARAGNKGQWSASESTRGFLGPHSITSLPGECCGMGCINLRAIQA